MQNISRVTARGRRRGVTGLCSGQAAGTKRAERRKPADRQGTAGQEVDGRAAHRQLQRAARQARHQAAACGLPACSDRMIRKLLILLCTLGTGGAFAEKMSIAPAHMARIGTIDARFQSYNVEMVEVTGGRFWKPYGSTASDASDKYAYRAPIDLANARLRKLAAALAPGYLRVSGTWANATYFADSEEPPSAPPAGFKDVLTRRQWKGVV